MLKREGNQIHRLIQVHEKPGHVRIGNRDRGLALDLVNEEGDHRAAAAHDIAIPRAGQNRTAALERLLCPGLDDLLPDRFRHAHGVDRVSGLVGRKEHNRLHPCLNCSRNHVVGADDVRPHSLHREELTGRDLLECRSMEHIVGPVHDITDGIQVTHVADIELNLAGILRVLCLQRMPHPVLLLLITADNTDFADLRGEKVLQDR